MTILFIVPSYKPAYIYGGTIVVVAMLAEQLVTLGHKVTIYTTTANGKTELDVKPGVETDIAGVKVFYFKRLTGDHTHASPFLWKQVHANIKNFDVVHIHSWWNMTVLGAAWVCKLNGVKPIISPHGMLSEYILHTNNSGAKTWVHRLLGKSLLKNSWLHVSTKLEWDESRRIIPGWAGKIVPNLVELQNQSFQSERNELFTIGFLSRIDPKKGLDILIKALSQVSFPFKLLVAGSGDKDYINSLKDLSISCGIDDKIEWVGWKNGESKFSFLAKLDLFALISHSENFAVVVIEALSVGTPVLVSENVGLSDYVFENDYGWVTKPNVESTAQNLIQLVQDKQKLIRINQDVPALIKKEYDGSRLAKQYLQLYKTASKEKVGKFSKLIPA